MKQYIVSLYIRSRSLSPAEITRLMGTEPSCHHEKGSLNDLGTACFLNHFWRLVSEEGDEASLASHLDSLMSRLSGWPPTSGDPAPGDLDIVLGVGVMSDTYTTSVLLSRSLVRFASGIGAGIEVSTYPTVFDETDS